MAIINKFYRGSSVFACDVCGRKTRDTGAQSLGQKICPQCYELAGIENEISDGHCTHADRIAEIEALVAEVGAKGGNECEWDNLIAGN